MAVRHGSDFTPPPVNEAAWTIYWIRLGDSVRYMFTALPAHELQSHGPYHRKENRDPPDTNRPHPDLHGVGSERDAHLFRAVRD